MKRKLIEVEKVMLYDSEDSMKHEDPEVKEVTIFNNTIILNDEKDDEKIPVEKIEIKTEANILTAEPLKAEAIKQDNKIPDPPSNTFDSIRNINVDMSNTENDVGNTKNDISNTNTDRANDVDVNDDIGNTDHVDNTMSSDDENIFLDIVKKAVKGESKLVFLDNIEMEPVKKKKKYTKRSENSKRKVHKFEKPKKEYLSSEHWRKFNLSEEEAMHEFKQRENSDQYVNANYKCHNCLKGFSKVEMLMRHVKFRHEEVRLFTNLFQVEKCL